MNENTKLIGAYAFMSLEIDVFAIPEGIEYISSFAFYNCSTLCNLTIPASIKTFKNRVFEGCKQLMEVHYNGTLEQCFNISFDNDFYSNPLNAYENGSNLYLKDVCLETITIPNTITKIENRIFNGCKSFNSVDYEKNSQLKTIDTNAFRECDNLGSVTLPKSLESIGEGAFSSCPNINSVVFEEGKNLTAISKYLFYNCSKLTKITLPSSITTIERGAFENCQDLKTINFNGTKEQWNNITKASDWKYKSSITEVKYSDGNVSIS